MYVITKKYKEIFNFPVCHRLPERSFFFRGRQFPLCSRCTGLIVGLWFYPFFIFNIITLPLFFILSMHVPMIIDGMTQSLCKRESKNWLRFMTGLMAGASQVAFMDYLAETISSHFYQLIF